jgi:uncharacterized protein YndB with AHSA1/START domain
MKNEFNDPSDNGEMIPQGERATIIFKRLLHHPPELIWEALTDPEALKNWFMASSAKFEGGAGGTYEMVAGPAQIKSTGKILTWQPPRVLEYEWKTGPRTEIPKGEDCVVRWELTAQGKSTLLMLTFKNITQQTAFGFTPGLHTFLDRLAAQMDHVPLPDWHARFSEVFARYPWASAWKK